MPLSADTKVYPNDTPLQYSFLQDINKGDGLNLSDFTTTTHIGTHADAPLHYVQGAKAIGALDLSDFIGECLVVRLNKANKGAVSVREIEAYGELPQRVLFCTMLDNVYNQWIDDYRPLSVELINYLHAKEVRLVGIDTPSVDAYESADAEVHHQIFANNMLIIENLYLNGVPEGRYELIALPLKFMELEASPVRAILRTL